MKVSVHTTHAPDSHKDILSTPSMAKNKGGKKSKSGGKKKKANSVANTADAGTAINNNDVLDTNNETVIETPVDTETGEEVCDVAVKNDILESDEAAHVDHANDPTPSVTTEHEESGRDLNEDHKILETENVDHKEPEIVEFSEIREPAVEEPAVEEPAVEEPIAEEPITEEPIAEEPIAEEPIAEEPIAEEPIAEEPIIEGLQERSTHKDQPEEPVSTEINETEVVQKQNIEPYVDEVPLFQHEVAINSSQDTTSIEVSHNIDANNLPTEQIIFENSITDDIMPWDNTAKDDVMSGQNDFVIADSIVNQNIQRNAESHSPNEDVMPWDNTSSKDVLDDQDADLMPWEQQTQATNTEDNITELTGVNTDISHILPSPQENSNANEFWAHSNSELTEQQILDLEGTVESLNFEVDESMSKMPWENDAVDTGNENSQNVSEQHNKVETAEDEFLNSLQNEKPIDTFSFLDENSEIETELPQDEPKNNIENSAADDSVEAKFDFLEGDDEILFDDIMDDDLLDDDVADGELNDTTNTVVQTKQEDAKSKYQPNLQPGQVPHQVNSIPQNNYISQPQNVYQGVVPSANQYGQPSLNPYNPPQVNIIKPKTSVIQLQEEKKKSNAYDFPQDLLVKNKTKPHKEVKENIYTQMESAALHHTSTSMPPQGNKESHFATSLGNLGMQPPITTNRFSRSNSVASNQSFFTELPPPKVLQKKSIANLKNPYMQNDMNNAASGAPPNFNSPAPSVYSGNSNRSNPYAPTAKPETFISQNTPGYTGTPNVLPLNNSTIGSNSNSISNVQHSSNLPPVKKLSNPYAPAAAGGHVKQLSITTTDQVDVKPNIIPVPNKQVLPLSGISPSISNFPNTTHLGTVPEMKTIVSNAPTRMGSNRYAPTAPIDTNNSQQQFQQPQQQFQQLQQPHQIPQNMNQQNQQLLSPGVNSYGFNNGHQRMNSSTRRTSHKARTSVSSINEVYGSNIVTSHATSNNTRKSTTLPPLPGKSGKHFVPPTNAFTPAPVVINPENLVRRQWPLFSFSGVDKIATMIPNLDGYNHNICKIKVIDLSVTLKNEPVASSFPGPLTKSKTKKKDIIKFIDDVIASENGEGSLTDCELLTWKCLHVMLEYVEKTGDFTNTEYINKISTILNPSSTINDGLNNVFDLMEVSRITQSFSPNKQFNAFKLDDNGINHIQKLLEAGNKKRALEFALMEGDWSMALIISRLMGDIAFSQIVKLYTLTNLSDSSLSDHLNFFIHTTSTQNNIVEQLKGKERWVIQNLNVIIPFILMDNTGYGKVLSQIGEALIKAEFYSYGKLMLILSGLPLIPKSLHDIPSSLKGMILEEIYDFILMTSGNVSGNSPHGLPHMIPLKVRHAGYLADIGLMVEAKKYCDNVQAAIASKQVFCEPTTIIAHASLTGRLAHTGSGWLSSKLSRPQLDRVWNTLDKSFNKFVSGEDVQPIEPKVESGVFSKFTSPASLSRTASNLDLADVKNNMTGYPLQSNLQLNPSNRVASGVYGAASTNTRTVYPPVAQINANVKFNDTLNYNKPAVSGHSGRYAPHSGIPNMSTNSLPTIASNKSLDTIAFPNVASSPQPVTRPPVTRNSSSANVYNPTFAMTPPPMAQNEFENEDSPMHPSNLPPVTNHLKSPLGKFAEISTPTIVEPAVKSLNNLIPTPPVQRAPPKKVGAPKNRPKNPYAAVKNPYAPVDAPQVLDVSADMMNETHAISTDTLPNEESSNLNTSVDQITNLDRIDDVVDSVMNNINHKPFATENILPEVDTYEQKSFGADHNVEDSIVVETTDFNEDTEIVEVEEDAVTEVAGTSDDLAMIDQNEHILNDEFNEPDQQNTSIIDDTSIEAAVQEIPVQESAIPVQESAIPVQESAIPVQESAIPVPVQETPIPVQESPVPVQESPFGLNINSESITDDSQRTINQSVVTGSTVEVLNQPIPRVATPQQLANVEKSNDLQSIQSVASASTSASASPDVPKTSTPVFKSKPRGPAVNRYGPNAGTGTIKKKSNPYTNAYAPKSHSGLNPYAPSDTSETSAESKDLAADMGIPQDMTDIDMFSYGGYSAQQTPSASETPAVQDDVEENLETKPVITEEADARILPEPETSESGESDNINNSFIPTFQPPTQRGVRSKKLPHQAADLTNMFSPPSALANMNIPKVASPIHQFTEEKRYIAQDTGEYYDEIIDDSEDEEDDTKKLLEQKRKAEEEEKKRKEAEEAEKKKRKEEDAKNKKASAGKEGGWFGWIGKGKQDDKPKPIKAKLGEENSFYYDEELKRWINKKQPLEEQLDAAKPPPPPSMKKPTGGSTPSSVTPSNQPSASPSPSPAPAPASANASAPPSAKPPGGPPTPGSGIPPKKDAIDDLLNINATGTTGTRRAGGRRGPRRGYVDVMGNN